MSESRSVKFRELKIFFGHPARTTFEMLVDSSLFSTTMSCTSWPGPHQVRVGVAIPVAHQRDYVVRRAQKRVAHHAVARPQPVHPVLVGVAGVAANHAQIVVRKRRSNPSSGSTTSATAQRTSARRLSMFLRLERADAVPVRLLHPALVGVGILRPVVHNGPAAQHLHVIAPSRSSGCRRNTTLATGR